MFQSPPRDHGTESQRDTEQETRLFGELRAGGGVEQKEFSACHGFGAQKMRMAEQESGADNRTSSSLGEKQCVVCSGVDSANEAVTEALRNVEAEETMAGDTEDVLRKYDSGYS